VLILALAAAACGGGAPADATSAAATATLTLFSLPPEITVTPTAPPDGNPDGPVDPALTPPPDTIVEITVTPTQPVAGSTPAINVTDPAPPVVRTLSGPLCNDSMFVEDVTIRDGTTLQPEEEFKKTWRIKNTGVCTWTTDYALAFAYGNPLKGGTTKLTDKVGPGTTVDITVRMVAPKVNGWYGSWWRMKSDKGENFGDFIFASIVIVDGIEPTATPPG
jgi:hypothetical protein